MARRARSVGMRKPTKTSLIQRALGRALGGVYPLDKVARSKIARKK
ncbi:MAG: hypothetical protein QXK06_01590 [Candidatus Diapherotrites archaeon]